MVGNDQNKQYIFGAEQVSQGRFLLSQKLEGQYRILCELFQTWVAVLFLCMMCM